MKKLKKILLGIIAALMLVTLAACSSSSKDDSLQKIKNKGKIVVAMNPEFAPFEFKTLVNGKDTIVGADVEIAKAIAKELGVKVEFSAMSFNNVLSSVQSGKADIGISGISATKERQNKKTNSLKGLSVATQKGTIQETVAKEQLTGAKIVSLVQNGEMINELKSGQVNGVVLEKPIAEGYVAKNDDLAIAQIKLKSSSSDAYAVAMPKGSSALKKKVDKVIKKLKKANKIDKFVKDAYNLSVSGGK